jgi:hypothetical protein
MKIFSFRFATIAAAVLFTTGANATIWAFMSTLSGANEVPPNASPATGTSMGTYDDVTNMFMMDTSASGFTANVTAAHVHVAPAGTNGGVLFPLTGATGSTNYTSNDMAVLSASEEIDFLAGNFYVNIHTSQFPGGEIRGQLEPTAVPEPATLIGIIAALGIFAAARRKR